MTGGVATAAAGSAPSEAPAGATAAFCHPTQCVREAARAVTTERVYGSLDGRYKQRYPNQLNWNNNGCSIPTSVIEDISPAAADVLRHFGGKFERSCDRHDFGYRNHGLHGYSRFTVDIRFCDNMRHQCDVLHIDGLPPWLACRAAANTFYTVVNLLGGRWW